MVVLSDALRSSAAGISSHDLAALTEMQQRSAEAERQVKSKARIKAEWTDFRLAQERRDQIRSAAAFDVQLTPLSIDMVPQGEPLKATLLNYSETGACLQHERLITEPFIRIEWHDHHDDAHIAIVKLKWCRSIAHNSFLTGGRVIRMD